MFLKISQNSPVSESYNFIKKETLAQVFSSEFYEIFKNTYFYSFSCKHKTFLS